MNSIPKPQFYKTYYTCNCCCLGSLENWKKAKTSKFILGQKVKNRCKNIQRSAGIIIEILERRFCIVKYGKNRSDEILESFDELILIE